ncbi:hypothetical protein ABG067_007371, partial [Albugo candida]
MGSGGKNAVVDSLEMFADIADDILIEVIDEYCCHSFKIQQNKFERETHHHPKKIAGEIPNLREERNSVSNEIPGANAMYKGQSSCQNHGSNQFRLFGVVMTPQIEQSSADSNDVSEGYQFVSGTSDNLSKREKNADATKNLLAFAANSNEREKKFSTNGAFEDGADLNVHLEGKSSKDISDRESKKPRTGVQKLRTISCILLEPNLPELWIQNCARCLTFIRKVDRFFIGRSSPGNYRWAFLSTATEDDLLECEGACGIIMLGSEIDCPAARLYNMVHDRSIRKSQAFVPYSYMLFNVAYDETKMQECLSCARSNIIPFVDRNNEREKYFIGLTSGTNDLSDFKEKCLLKDICKRLSGELHKEFNIFDWKTVGSSKNEAKESHQINIGKKWTPSFPCMHLTAPLNGGRDTYRYPIDVEKKESRDRAIIPDLDRFFIGRSSPGSYRWAFLSTATEDELLECEGACGIIMLGSEIDCPVARLYSMVHDRSIRKSQVFVPYSYMLINVAYDETKMQECLSCARSNIIPFVDRNNEREKYFIGFTSGTNDLSDFKEKCLLEDICKRLYGKLLKEFNIFDWKTLGSSKNKAKESHPINIGKKWTPSFPCMHLNAPLNGGRDTYRYPIDAEKKESRDRAIIPDCLACMLTEFDSFERVPSSKFFTHSIQPTSLTSSLVFFTQELHVQEAAIKCTEKCAWVSGLSESMCSDLKSMTPK